MASTRESLIQTADHRTGVGGPPVVTAVVIVAAANMLIGGVWAFAWPESFAAFVQFPFHQDYRHFLHDAGAFTIGIGATLLLALWWRDAIAVALFGFVVATAVHAVSHFIDRDLGGRPTDWVLLTVLALVAAAALAARLRFLKERSVMP
ncbi:MAG: hypothetical protein ACRDJC_06285 [Thermomicrobiales bacterium]